MRFALFYEIPVARPWGPDSERLAYQQTIEQAVAGERYGWDAFWTVEHHFLEEYSHCSYNHPVRTAEAVAVLDLISNGRVDLGTGRSSTRAELEGFGIDPASTRGMWQEAIGHVVGCWTNDEYEFAGEHWSMPKRRVLPKPIQLPHPPIWGATSSEDGHRQVGALGLGLCSFAVGVSPEAVKEKIDIYREAVAGCTTPIGAYVHDQASTFTMAVCAPTTEEAWATARESFEWYPRFGARLIASVADMQADRGEDLGTYAYAADLKTVADDGSLDLLSLEYLVDSGACVLGTPEQAIETCKRYEAAGVDQLLCLVNPYKIPHEAVMQTIQMMGEHVIPEFR